MAVLGSAASGAAAVGDPPRVRSTDAALLALFKEGTERSATFRRLVETIGRSNGIVYVQWGYCSFGHLDGCVLPFVGSVQGDRYLRILVIPAKTRRTHDQLLALIAHELQHAIEILDHPEVVDTTTLEAMYRKIGTPYTGGVGGYETSEARKAGDAVLSELSNARV